MATSSEPIKCDMGECGGVLEPKTVKFGFFAANKAFVWGLRPGNKCTNCSIEVFETEQAKAFSPKLESFRASTNFLNFSTIEEFSCPNPDCDGVCSLDSNLKYEMVIDEELRLTHSPGYHCPKCQTTVYSAEQWQQLEPLIMKLVREPAS